MTLAAFHFALSLTLFLLVNWIGLRLYSKGYVPLTLLPQFDRAPVLNAGVRVLIPLVYLVLVSTLLYRMGQDDLVTDIYLVSAYYVGFRWLFNVGWGRASLLNWPKELAYAGLIIGGSWWLYDAVIQNRINLLPDPVNLATEVWLFVAVFIFYMLNELGGADTGSRERKNRYVVRRAGGLRRKYEAELLAGIPGVNHKVEALVLAIMVYESFNRPFVARLVEYAAFFAGRSKTLGIMQVSTDTFIDDRESVRLGIARITSAWNANKHLPHEYEVTWAIARDYNPDDDYAAEILQLTKVVFRGLYDASDHRLTSYEHLFGPREDTSDHEGLC